MADHFIRYFSCGKHVDLQCRCADQNKRKEISNSPCPHDDCRRVDAHIKDIEAQRQAGTLPYQKES